MKKPEFMIRLTTQRQILLEELSKKNYHPTVCEIYKMVQKRLPKIGLGTVYRNLELMVKNGVIVKLEVGGAQKRFDAITKPHYHIRCCTCNRLDDIEVEIFKNLTKIAERGTLYEIIGHQVEFKGECPACQHKNKIVA
jgi:Fur family ferric uptake transcriptional regulator